MAGKKRNTQVLASGTMTLMSLFAMGMPTDEASANSMIPDWAKTKGITTERCAGVAQAGKNDCAAGKHGCAGMAVKDRDPQEWLYTPTGLCEKIGGKVLADAGAAKKK